MAETEVIHQQMEETRARLAENLDKLSQQTLETVGEVAEAVTETVGTVQETAAAVSETVQAVTETTEETVEGLKEFFNIPRQVERYPWLMFGGSVVLGYIAGSALPSIPSTREEDTGMGDRQATEPARQFVEGNGHREEQPSASGEQEESWFSGILETLRPAFDRLKGLAIGASLGLARDAITQSLSGDLGHQLREVFDDMTTRLGGQPVNPVEESSSSPPTQRGSHEHGNATEMERPLGTGSR